MIVLNIILALLGNDLHSILSKPFSFVKDLTGSWLGLMVIMLLTHLLWAVGVHGTSIIKNSFINPILLVALTENIEGGKIFLPVILQIFIFLWVEQVIPWV